MSVLSFLSRFDALFAFSILVLVGFGFLSLSSTVLSNPDVGWPLVVKQATALFLGLASFSILALSNHRLWRGWSLAAYLFSVTLLFLVLFFGVTLRGTTGWFSFGGVHFQPVELAKFGLVVYLASYFSRRTGAVPRFSDVWKTGCIVFLPVLLTLAQPDAGSAFVFICIWIAFLVFSGVRAVVLLGLGGSGVLASIFAYFFLLADYQRSRISTFFHASQDPLGEGYNVVQSMIAIGSGRWFGRGLGSGVQSQLHFLPESQTDFVFAALAEEWGFVGVSCILAAFALFFWRLFQHATKTQEPFTAYLLIGIASVFFATFVVNVGMNLGVLPVTGLVLPFVSYGGSSLVVALAMAGVAMSAMKER